jgi:hypothetical protein
MLNPGDAVVTLDLSQYRSFISEFRRAVGIGARSGSNGQVVVKVARARSGVAFRFNVHDVYMSDVWGTGGRWNPIQRGNYAQMGIRDDYLIDANQIEQALLYPPPPTAGERLAVAILVTSEAARSQVIYQSVQQILQSPGVRAAAWSNDFIPLLRLWGEFTTDHHKRKPKAYGALGARDYYDEPSARTAIDGLKTRGFTIDA